MTVNRLAVPDCRRPVSAAQMIMLGILTVAAVGGGVESMSNAAYYQAPAVRWGVTGDAQLIDMMVGALNRSI